MNRKQLAGLHLGLLFWGGGGGGGGGGGAGENGFSGIPSEGKLIRQSHTTNLKSIHVQYNIMHYPLVFHTESLIL